MFGLGAGEIFLILAFALIFIGPKKLPELARSLGKGIREFQNAKDELIDQVKYADHDNENDKSAKNIAAPTPIDAKDAGDTEDHHHDISPESKSEKSDA